MRENKYFARTCTCIIFVLLNFRKMNSRLLNQLRENLAILETKEKNLTMSLKSRKRNKVIALVIALISVFAMIVAPGNSDDSLVGFEELALVASVVMWFVNWRALNKANAELSAVTSEIGKSKIEIIEAELS